MQQPFSLQRQSNIPVGPVSPEFESSLSHARSGGSPLEPKIQTQMESAIGADFSRVKVHTDTQADYLSRSIQAKAFTTGNDVFFKQGAYAPNSRSGQELLAHELTHVVQQGGSSIRRKDEVTDDSEQSNIDNIIDSIQDGDNLEELIFTDTSELENTSETDEIIESMQVEDDVKDPVFLDKPKKDEVTESSQKNTDQKTDINSNTESSLKQIDKSPEKSSNVNTIKESLEAVENAYTSAEDNTLSIERLKYAFEEDKQIIEPYKDYSLDDTKQELERVKKKKEEVELKLLSPKNLKTRLIRSDDEANKYDEEIHEYDQQIECLKTSLKTKDFQWDKEWEKSEIRVSAANKFYTYAIKDKATITESWYLQTVIQKQGKKQVSYRTVWSYLDPAMLRSDVQISPQVFSRLNDFIRDSGLAQDLLPDYDDTSFERLLEQSADFLHGSIASLTEKDSDHVSKSNAIVEDIIDSFVRISVETMPSIDDEEDSTSLLRTVMTFLTEAEVEFEYSIDASALHFRHTGQHGEWNCYARTQEENQVFVFYSIPTFQVPQEKITEVLYYICQANYGLVMGNLEMDIADGEIRYKTSIDVDGDTLSLELVRNMVYANVSLMDQYLPGLMAILEQGKSAEDAIALVEA